MKLEQYQSFKEKARWFDKHFVVNSVTEVELLFNELDTKNNANSFYRGSSNAKYKLYNSAQRLWITNELNNVFHDYSSFIKKLVGNFKENNSVSKFFNKFSIPLTDIPLLAFMQHYGSPTPLLDLSYNPWVALFFAIENISYTESKGLDNFFSFYVIQNYDFISLQTEYRKFAGKIKNIDFEKYGRKIDKTELNKATEQIIQDLTTLDHFKNGPPEIITDNIENFRYYTDSNFNIINQEGMFVYNPYSVTPLEKSFHMYLLLQATKPKDEKIPLSLAEFRLNEGMDLILSNPNIKAGNYMTCYDIHKSLIGKLLKELENRKITTEFVYPNPIKMVNEALKKTLEQI